MMLEGEVGDRMYILVRGTVEASNDSKVVATLSAGVVIGEMALLDVFGEAGGTSNGRRTASITCVTSCDVRSLHKDHFQRVLQGFPEEKEYFMAAALERLEELKEKLLADEHAKQMQ